MPFLLSLLNKYTTNIVINQKQYDGLAIPFKRGDILDRNGTTIATSTRVYNVILDSYVMLSNKKVEDDQAAIMEVKLALEECFGIDPADVDEVVANNPDSRYNIMIKRASYEQAQLFEKFGI